jgi:hypothetical protein
MDRLWVKWQTVAIHSTLHEGDGLGIGTLITRTVMEDRLGKMAQYEHGWENKFV